METYVGVRTGQGLLVHTHILLLDHLSHLLPPLASFYVLFFTLMLHI